MRGRINKNIYLVVWMFLGIENWLMNVCVYGWWKSGLKEGRKMLWIEMDWLFGVYETSVEWMN